MRRRRLRVERQRTTKRFSQLDSTATRNYEGTGLGLAISKSLVQLMGGAIKIESVEGEGSIISFTIPLEPSTVGEEQITREAITNPYSYLEAAPKSKKKLKILLVEDKLPSQKLVSYLLEGRGWKVTSAFNGKQALELLESNTFDLVLMDVQMPEMDGLETTRQVRAREANTGEHIPIIALTASAMQADVHKCMVAGMDGVISKPIDSKILIRQIEAIAGIEE